jgi:myo-inositol 2-dehydrogenase/D-chiro-inositol 1-dehydrogenase
VLDDEPVAIAVKAPRGNSRAGGVADPLFTLMDMRSGALVTIETSVHIAYGYDIRGEVVGETGTVSLAEQNEVVLKVNGAFSGRVFADWPERFDPAFDAEFRAWLGAAAKGGAAGPSAWDGYVATAATLAGVKALESGAREPIALREKPALYA